MESFVFFLYCLVPATIFFFVLYFVVKAAVRDGILAAEAAKHSDSPTDAIATMVCPQCGKAHDIDYPKCPHCGHVNFS